MRKLSIFLCLSGLLALTTCQAGTVDHYQLSNGLELFVKVDKRAPVVVSQVWYKVGSYLEPNGITGISHVLEHMMYEGSTHYPDDEFSKIIANNGGEENATTDYDYTCYYQILAANKLPISFQLEADRMQNLTLSETSFKKEIKVVREERRMRLDNNPQGLTFERFMAAAFISNPYHHPVVGWMDNLMHLTDSDVRNWYEQWYAPNNAIIVVVGDVDPKSVYALAQKYFGSIPSHPLPMARNYSDVPALGERTVTVNVPAKLPWLIMGYNVPSLKTAKIKWEPWALALASDILSSGDGSRLPTDLIRGREVASQVDADYDPFSRLSTLFILDGTPASKHGVMDLRKNLLSEIKKLQTTPVSQEELNRVKTQLIAQKTYDKDSISNQADQIGSLEAVGLSWKVGDDFISEIQKITPAQIQAAAKKYFILDRLTIAYLKPAAIKSSTVTTDTSITSGVSNVH